jgi:hypothetical protein
MGPCAKTQHKSSNVSHVLANLGRSSTRTSIGHGSDPWDVTALVVLQLSDQYIFPFANKISAPSDNMKASSFGKLFVFFRG